MDKIVNFFLLILQPFLPFSPLSQLLSKSTQKQELIKSRVFTSARRMPILQS